MTAYLDRARRLTLDQPALRVRPLLRFDPSPELAPIEVHNEVEADAEDFAGSAQPVAARSHRETGYETPASSPAEPAGEPAAPATEPDEADPAVAIEAPSTSRAEHPESEHEHEPENAALQRSEQRPPVIVTRDRAATAVVGTPAIAPEPPAIRTVGQKPATTTPAIITRHIERTEQRPAHVELETEQRRPAARTRPPRPTAAAGANASTERADPVDRSGRRVRRSDPKADPRPDEVTITIGRIEVKVAPAAAPAPAAQVPDRRKGSRSEPTRLDDYLRARTSGRIG